MRLVRVLRAWGVPVVWVACDEAPAKLTAAAETAPAAVVNNYYLLPPGTDVRGLSLALPPGTAATEEE